MFSIVHYRERLTPAWPHRKYISHFLPVGSSVQYGTIGVKAAVSRVSMYLNERVLSELEDEQNI